MFLAVKGLAGGCLVVVFALLSQTLTPKRFAGLFSAAPAVAIASLTIGLLDKGPLDVKDASRGMIAGGVAMALYAAVVIPMLRRTKASRAAALALIAWFAAAAIVALPVLLA
jgi:uncharacterized membrane protein (GlpM family)